jgi:cyclic-di-GMP-binding protein
MATVEYSFDLVSRVDPMEIKNAIDQAQRELMNRYDFKGGKSEILHEKEDITLIADDEFKMDQLKDIVFSKMLKRGIDSRQFEWGKVEESGHLTVRCKVELKNGISQDKAKPLIKQIRDSGIKVNCQIQGEEIRVSSKSKDDLQKAMQFAKGLSLDFPIDFVNLR